MLNIGFQTLGNDAISMASSLLSGNSIEAYKMVFFFGIVRRFIWANVAKKKKKNEKIFF